MPASWNEVCAEASMGRLRLSDERVENVSNALVEDSQKLR